MKKRSPRGASSARNSKRKGKTSAPRKSSRSSSGTPKQRGGSKKRLGKTSTASEPRKSRPSRGRPNRSATPKSSTAPDNMVRIQKYLSEVGVASRRLIEEMVLEGRVEVNGELRQELPIFVDPEVDEIRIDGQRVRKRTVKSVYYLLNKPKNVVCTAKDPMGRKKAIDLLGGISERVYCVGRLDADSTGALLLTNDGELTQHLTHPSHEVPKTYIVTVGGKVAGENIETIKTGIYLDGRRTGGANIKVLHRDSNRTVLEITLREGRNREIRRMLERFGYKVRRLHRVRIGPVEIKGLGPGSFRMLSSKEVRALYDAGKD